MNINDKNKDNEHIYEINESSYLTNNKSQSAIKSVKYSLISPKVNTIYIIIICSFLIITYLYFLAKDKIHFIPQITEYYNINTTKFQNKKTHPQFYWEKWIIMTTKNIPTIFFDKLLNVIDKNTWKILIVERGKNKISSSWEKYIKNNNVSDDVIYLSLESQKKLCYQTTKYISDNSYGRKNIGYLYAIEHGAKEILDIDDDILFNSNPINSLKTNLTRLRLCYANNIIHMINPYTYFGRPDIWPRGFRLKDTNKNNTYDFYTAMGDRLLIKPLIFNGLMKNPDLDTIYLQTRENIYLENKNKKFYKPSPLFYIPGNYVPINSKNTLFLYEAFPAIALPISVTMKVSDIWRGYLAQRYIWGFNGVTILTNSNANYRRNITNISLDFKEERGLFFELGNLLECLNKEFDENDIKYPGMFIIKLIEILVENNILDKNDLDMYKAFLYDIESFGYEYKSDYRTKINSDVNNYINTNPEFQHYLPSIPKIDSFTKLNPNITLLKHYTIQNKYDDILLMINYNYEFLTSLNNFITELYEQYFPNIVFITPGKEINDSNNHKMIACPESYKGYYSYYCIKRVYENYPSFKGYIFVMDDVFIKVWELEYLNFDIPWISEFSYEKTKLWLNSHDREEKLLEKNLAWQKNVRIFYNGKVLGRGISDFFYLPNYFVPDFINVAKVFYNYTVFLELAVPSIYGVLLKPKYQSVHFIGLWEEDRKKWKNYLYTSHKQIVVHPIKFSDINNQREVIKYLEFKYAKEY